MYDGPTIDCDVHYLPKRAGEIEQYLEPRLRDEALRPSAGGGVTVTEQFEGVARPDAIPEEGGPAGSSYELMREQLLDPYRIQVAVLNPAAGPKVSNNELGAALCVARNRWLKEHWLEGNGDDRLYGALMVPSHDVLGAAAEIRRTGDDERWAGAHIVMNSLGRHMGDAAYEPIYAALAERDLPLYIHGTIGELMKTSAPYQSGGASLHFRLEMFTMLYQATANHITSLITSGVFERYPNLKLVLAESGVSWVTWYATQLDANAALLRRESRWVKKRPSEYLRERLRMSTQPIEAIATDRERFVQNLSVVEGIDEILCFSSDYPHWDGDLPDHVGTIFPSSWHDKLFYENGRNALRLPSAVPVKPPKLAAA
jgi:predicted TIM-barrel fold metal-dependent hydrolase